jgi:hypothetical protein
VNVKQFANGTIDRSEAQELKYVYDALRDRFSDDLSQLLLRVRFRLAETC